MINLFTKRSGCCRVVTSFSSRWGISKKVAGDKIMYFLLSSSLNVSKYAGLRLEVARRIPWPLAISNSPDTVQKV